MLALILAFSIGGSIGFLAGCFWKHWVAAQAAHDARILRESSQPLS